MHSDAAYPNMEESDQTALMRKLVWAFSVCICAKDRFCLPMSMSIKPYAILIKTWITNIAL